MKTLAASAMLASMLGLVDRTSEPGQFVTCDNGLRCLMAPCPNLDTVNITTGERFASTDIDFTALPEKDRTGQAFFDGIYGGTLVFDGTLERFISRPDGETMSVLISATRVARTATEAEAELCQRQ
jgi:hypothetical protein